MKLVAAAFCFAGLAFVAYCYAFAIFRDGIWQGLGMLAKLLLIVFVCVPLITVMIYGAVDALWQALFAVNEGQYP